MNPKRPLIPKKLQNQVSDQCGYACANPKCRNPRSSRHEFHHIDENPGNNVLENLILLCAGCHSDHHHGTVSESDIRFWKRMAESGYLPAPTAPSVPAPMHVHHNDGIAAQHIEHLHVKTSPRKSGPAPILPGTIGADADRRDYANYLVKRYIEWRKMGVDRGLDRRKFEPASAQTILAKDFGSQTVFMIPSHQFSNWVSHAQAKIDNTIWGRKNSHRNYHTWEEHQKKRHGKTDRD